MTSFAIVPAVLLPGPAEVFATFLDILKNGYRDTSLLQNALATLWRCGFGFLLACLTGIPLGLAMGTWPAARGGLQLHRRVHAAVAALVVPDPADPLARHR